MEILLAPGRLQRTKAGKRKLRLFSTACCRSISELLTEEQTRLVDLAEEFADLKVRYSQMQEAALRIPLPSSKAGFAEYAVWNLVDNCRHSVASGVAKLAAMEYSLPLTDSITNSREAAEIRCQFLRDIFGNPFRPVSFNPSWRTSTAVAIAKGMYASRDFSAMPILADALQDAGCEHANILDHCHGPGPHVKGSGPHVKGCWVVDLVLGKE